MSGSILQDAPQALAGLKVLELGQLIAGPFATKLLGEFGADVIKIEPPGTGDPLRRWRVMRGDTSLWWHVQTRNKRSVSLDLKSEQGQDIVKRLVAEADIVVENFSPGRLEKWGLGWEALSAINPALIMVRISGYGQTGPYRDLPGFGVIGEAMGGLRYLSGHPGESSVRVGVSIGDSLSALYGVIGALLALQERQRALVRAAGIGPKLKKKAKGNPETPLDLETGCLILSAVDRGDIDESHYTGQLDSLAAGAARALSHTRTGREQLRAFIRIPVAGYRQWISLELAHQDENPNIVRIAERCVDQDHKEPEKS